MYKQCKDGFCYCFTSDSDCSKRIPDKKRSRRKVVHQLSSPKKLSIAEKNERNNCIRAISTLEEDFKSDAPMIHIIQQIHNNCVISEVRVNKSHLRGPVPLPRKTRRSCPAPVIEEIVEVTEEEEQPVCKEPSTPPKKSCNKAGKLLEKRLSYSAGQKEKPKRAYQTDVFSTLPKGTPPPKPPRSARSLYSSKSKSTDTLDDDSSQTSSLRNAERVLNSFLKSKGYEVPKYPPKIEEVKSRKSLPSTNYKSDKAFPAPSCPNLSEIDEVIKDYEMGWTTKGKKYNY